VNANLITFDGEEELSDVDIYITDEHYRLLTLAPNQQFEMILNSYHNEDSL